MTVSAVALLLTVLMTLPSTADESTSRRLAEEVCEDMVRDSMVAAAGEPLSAPQQGSWDDERYVCSYPFLGGTLKVRVDTFPRTANARAAFRTLRNRSTHASTLFGIGEQAFTRRDRSVIARKDAFVLTVDPHSLPARMNRDSVAWSTTRAIFDCW